MHKIEISSEILFLPLEKKAAVTVCMVYMVKVLGIQDNATTQPNPVRRGFTFPNLV